MAYFSKQKLLLWSRDLVILFILLALLGWWQARDTVKGEAPLLHGQLLDGSALIPTQYIGKPIMIHFWATWCPICRLEDQSIHNVAEKYPVITVATTSGSAKEIQQYLDQEGLVFPVLMDESGDIGREWGLKGVPATFFVDSQGDIRSAQIGYTSELGMLARLWWLD